MMARMILDTLNSDQTRRVRRIIGKRLGEAAELVFGEAAGNVLQHTQAKWAEVSLHADGFRLASPDHAATWVTGKAEGEGGYGLSLIAALGGRVTCQSGVCIEWER